MTSYGRQCSKTLVIGKTFTKLSGFKIKQRFGAILLQKGTIVWYVQYLHFKFEFTSNGQFDKIDT